MGHLLHVHQIQLLHDNVVYVVCVACNVVRVLKPHTSTEELVQMVESTPFNFNSINIQHLQKRLDQSLQ